MTAQSPQVITLCTILYALVFTQDDAAFAFTTGGGSSSISGAIHREPIVTKQEWQHPGSEIELPNLELLFERIATASPLARLVMEGDPSKQQRGFDAIDDGDDNTKHPELRWKKVEENSRRSVHRIDRADRYQGLKTPLLRFRSSIKGPCIGERFVMIMDLNERKKWDDQVARVEELHPISDLCSIPENCLLPILNLRIQSNSSPKSIVY